MANERGFTLIEVMVVTAIVGILASIALPQYTQYIQRGWRADARAILLDNAQFMARVYSQNLDYKPGNKNPALPTIVAPAQGSKKYDITVAAVAGASSVASSFILTAADTGWDEKCGDLTINQLGEKSASIPKTAAARADCWQR